ncbi:MAG TPA: iron-sulfur cluster assembly protein [Burkholderiaceae bacterium]|nr:iron-sulfur cluster assembly protein [Burkholderiaceae bacterium]
MPITQDQVLAALATVIDPNTGRDFVASKSAKNVRVTDADASFANIVTDQVLEHVGGDPKVAIDESLRVLVPGGVAVHTTCFINPVHDAPADYWRFTPEALRLLCRDYEVLGAGGWGNKWVWVVDALGLRFDPVPHSAWHPLHRVATHDDPTWPVVTWIVVRKAG